MLPSSLPAAHRRPSPLRVSQYLVPLASSASGVVPPRSAHPAHEGPGPVRRPPPTQAIHSRCHGDGGMVVAGEAVPCMVESKGTPIRGEVRYAAQLRGKGVRQRAVGHPPEVHAPVRGNQRASIGREREAVHSQIPIAAEARVRPGAHCRTAYRIVPAARSTSTTATTRPVGRRLVERRSASPVGGSAGGTGWPPKACGA